jgi:hypothetical protein
MAATFGIAATLGTAAAPAPGTALSGQTHVIAMLPLSPVDTGLPYAPLPLASDLDMMSKMLRMPLAATKNSRLVSHAKVALAHIAVHEQTREAINGCLGIVGLNHTVAGRHDARLFVGQIDLSRRIDAARRWFGRPPARLAFERFALGHALLVRTLLSRDSSFGCMTIAERMVLGGIGTDFRAVDTDLTDFEQTALACDKQLLERRALQAAAENGAENWRLCRARGADLP